MRPSWTRKTAAVATIALAIGAMAAFVAPAPPVDAAPTQSTCPASLALVNGSFEQSTPLVTSGWEDALDSNVPGWSTTESDHEIELWRSGFDPDGLATFIAPDGNQSAELNANTASTLYQTLDTTAYEGKTVQWQLYHRGRYSSTVPDVMNVLIGSSLATMTAQDPTGASSPAIGDTNVAWGRWTGSYTIPAGQSSTVFAFQAVSSTGPGLSYGNELDDVSFGTDACVVTTKTVTDQTRATEAQVGDTLHYSVTADNQGGNPAQRSVATDVLPTGVSYVSGSLAVTNNGVADSDAVASYDAATHTITVRLGSDATPTSGGSITADTHSTFSYDAVVNSTGPIPIDNSASVNYYEPLGGSTQTSQSNTVETAVQNLVTAVADTSVTPLNTPVTTAVLGNDKVIPGGAPLNPGSTFVTAPAIDGTTSVNSVSGAITYAPTAGFTGQDSYKYQVCDESTVPICGTATVTVTVSNLFFDGPSTTGITTPQNAPITVPLTSISSTAAAPLNPTAVSSAAAPTHGTIAIDPATGAVTYTPTSNYTGPDSYSIDVCDTSVPSQCHVVTIPVTVQANVVTGVNDSLSTLSDAAADEAVMANDTVLPGGAALDPTSVTITTPPSHGSTTVNPVTGVVRYTPDAGYSGADAYQYSVCDKSYPVAICGSATVIVTVDNVVVPGPASSGYPGGGGGVTTPQNKDISSTFADIASSVGAPLDPTATTLVHGTSGHPALGPNHGTVAINPVTGDVTYTPSEGYTGDDLYQLRVCDVESPAVCDIVNMTVTVLPNVVDAHSDWAKTSKDHKATLAVMGNDVSMSGQPLNPASIVLGTGSHGPSHGHAWVNKKTGVVSYMPNAKFVGVDSFDYTVCDTSDPSAVCSATTVAITVDPPILAYTGSTSPVAAVRLASGLLLFGLIIVFLGRRRRSKYGLAD
jgi:uncharacterized repeat protein (TIGR01451 family)